MTEAQAITKIADLEYEALTAIRAIRELAQRQPEAARKAAQTLTHVATIAQVEQQAVWRVAAETPVQLTPVEWEGW